MRTTAVAPPVPLPALVHRLAEETVRGQRHDQRPAGEGWSYGGLPVRAEPGVSDPADPAEREAEAVADRVARDRDDTDDTDDTGDTGDTDEDAPGLVEPDLADEPWPGARADTVHASRDAGPAQSPPGFRADLAAAGAGEAVPVSVRAPVERVLGRSFAHVRLHRDARSDRLSRAIGARAFTWGSDVHLAATAPAATSPQGLRLLAHELTHVAQGPTTRVRRAEALYFSTHGRQGYFRYAARFHADHGFPAPVRVSSVEEMLEHMVGLPAGLSRVRLVSHAVPSGVFLPLLRGGGTSLFRSDLRLQSQGRLEGELATEHATVGRDDREVTVEHHLVPQAWADRLYRRLAADPGWTAYRGRAGLPATLTPGGDLETWLWWMLDRALLTTQQPTGRTRRGSPVLQHVLGLPAAARSRQVASLDRTLAYYSGLLRLHLIARAPARLTARQKEQQAEQALVDLRARVDGSAPDLVRTTVASGGLPPVAVNDPTPRYEGIQGALERGTYANNLLTMKSRLPDAMPFEIRGCRIGQNQAWLDAFRAFWGLGVGAPPAGRHPDVSAPDLRHVFGLQTTGRGRRARTESREWLEGPRGRRIQGGTPDFDQHIVHAR